MDAPDLSVSSPKHRQAAETDALAHAIGEVLRPLARIAVAKGMPFAAVETALKQAFVQAARDVNPHLPRHRAVSRIAIATGLTRREVTRLTESALTATPRQSLASELFTRWVNDPDYRDRDGRPRDLPRQGSAPSFESLALSVTRDVHPRSLLDELVRLGLAAHDGQCDAVSLTHEAFVPRGDQTRMLAFLGQNVGDHLSAAVANVLGRGNDHFEQAIFADELSPESLDTLRSLISAQWRALSATLVSAIESRIARDRPSEGTARCRLRIGLYTFTDHPNDPHHPPAAYASQNAAPLASPRTQEHLNGSE